MISQRRPPGVRHQNAQPLAHEVVGYLGHGPPARCVAGLGGDGGVDRVPETALVISVQVGEEGDSVAGPPVDAQSRVQAHHALGEGPGLIDAEDIHGADVLDGRQAFDDHFFAGHPARPLRQVDVDDRRQELPGQAHGQGQGEQERLQHRAVEVDVHREDGEHEEQGDLQEQVAETADAPLELGLGRAAGQALGDPADGRPPPRQNRHRRARPAGDVGAHEQRIAAPGNRRLGRQDARSLLHGVALAGQVRLVGAQAVGLEQAAVGRHQVAG